VGCGHGDPSVAKLHDHVHALEAISKEFLSFCDVARIPGEAQAKVYV
jgi:hypothetical protein